MKTGDICYQAQIMRHGHGLDYGCELRPTREAAQADLDGCLGMMSNREREQSEVESYVQKWRVIDVDEDGNPDLESAK